MIKKMKTLTDIRNYNLLVNLSQNLPPRVKILFFTGEEKLFIECISFYSKVYPLLRIIHYLVINTILTF
jgi:hypothetical protein